MRLDWSERDKSPTFRNLPDQLPRVSSCLPGCQRPRVPLSLLCLLQRATRKCTGKGGASWPLVGKPRVTSSLPRGAMERSKWQQQHHGRPRSRASDQWIDQHPGRAFLEMWVRHDETTRAVTRCNSLLPSISAQPNQLLAPFPVGSHTASDWLRVRSPSFGHPSTTPLPVCNRPCENPATSRQGIRPVRSLRERRLEALRVEEASMGVMVGDFWNSQSLQEAGDVGAGHWRHHQPK